MENNFDNKDFEQFVKQNADQYRMFPSEKVWRGIHNSLHTRKWWYSLGFGLLLLTSGAITWIMLSPSRKGQDIPANPIAIAPNNTVASQQKINEKTEVSSFTPLITKNSLFNTSPNSELKNEILPFYIAGTETAIAETGTVLVPRENTATVVENQSADKIEKEQDQPLSISISDQATDNTSGLTSPMYTGIGISEIRFLQERDVYPMSIESVVNSFVRKGKKNLFSWQIYFAPTISYRKLKENKAFLRSAQLNNNTFNYAALFDVNSVVTHKPDMGLELGFSAGYPLSKHVKLIAGLQFNVSKYDIRAYSHSTEVATIALNTGGGSSSVSTATNYRNFDGYKQDWLKNLYFSISAPIGTEIVLASGKKSYLGIGGTIQPTYSLDDRAYLLSTDYKNYAEVPSLMRKWNVNTSLESFAGYSTGKIKWKVGPQVRYQILSSFIKKYPVKEHLFDFGLKVGVMLNQ